MSETSTAHLSPKTGLIPAFNAWEMYLYDQGRSLNTIKAFLSDIRLFTLGDAARPNSGRHHHQRPEQLLALAGTRARRCLLARRVWQGASQPLNRFFAGCARIAAFAPIPFLSLCKTERLAPLHYSNMQQPIQYVRRVILTCA